MCRSGDQFCAAQTLDQTDLRRDLFPERERSTFALPRHGCVNTYLHFIESEWKRSLFTKTFYNRLSMCFGHIAHYDIHGFYETWFTCDKDRLEFL